MNHELTRTTAEEFFRHHNAQMAAQRRRRRIGWAIALTAAAIIDAAAWTAVLMSTGDLSGCEPQPANSGGTQGEVPVEAPLNWAD